MHITSRKKGKNGQNWLSKACEKWTRSPRKKKETAARESKKK
jgi:hypothetical protein